MTQRSADDATAQHVRRTLHALELLAENPRTQADVAQALQVHRRTARRLLARLVDEGYAELAPNGRHVTFRATSRLAVLGRQVADGLDVIEIARRHIDGLPPTGAGTRFVALPEGDGVVLVHVEEAPGADASSNVASLPRTGPFHATAAGKVFLSADTALVGEVLNQELLAYTERTLVARADLLLELARVRDRGWACEDAEHRVGIRAAASAVFDHVGRVVAAIGAVPMAETPLEQLGLVVRDAARSCSREMGASPEAAHIDTLTHVRV